MHLLTNFFLQVFIKFARFPWISEFQLCAPSGTWLERLERENMDPLQSFWGKERRGGEENSVPLGSPIYFLGPSQANTKKLNNVYSKNLI